MILQNEIILGNTTARADIIDLLNNGNIINACNLMKQNKQNTNDNNRNNKNNNNESDNELWDLICEHQTPINFDFKNINTMYLYNTFIDIEKQQQTQTTQCFFFEAKISLFFCETCFQCIFFA